MNNKYIEKREGKNGITYRVNYKGESRSFSEKKLGKDALPLARKYRDQLVSDDYMVTNFKTVKDVFEELPVFFNLRAETQRKYNLLFNKYMALYSNKLVLKLKRADIVECLNAMVETASDNTITRVLAMWKKISLYSVYNEIVQHDITYGIIAPKSHILSPPKKITDIDKNLLVQMETLCHTKIKSVLYREQYPCMLWLLYYTGMRIAEMLALLKTDIDLKERIIHINKEIGSSQSEFTVVRQCKTPTSVRDIPIVDGLIPYLTTAMALTDSDKLFPTTSDRYHDSTLLGDQLSQMAKRHGIKFNLYAIRHNFSTSLIDKTDIRTIQELMGHSNPDMSVQYARSSNAKKIDALKER